MGLAPIGGVEDQLELAFEGAEDHSVATVDIQGLFLLAPGTSELAGVGDGYAAVVVGRPDHIELAGLAHT